ncbi:MAG: nitric-oxide reductase large subunit [Sulfolobaceae archaeon]
MAGKPLSNIWPNMVLIATIIVYLVYFALAFYTLTHLPPIPTAVVTDKGDVILTGEEVVQGKILMQKYGLFDYGSFWGFGGYMGVDFTALALKIINDSINQYAKIYNVSVDTLKSIKVYGNSFTDLLNPIQGKFVVSEAYLTAYNNLYNKLREILSENSSSYALKPNLVNNATSLRAITSFIFWGALISMLGYTNGFPYTPGLTEPNIHVSLATWAMIVAALAPLVPMITIVSMKFLDHWRDPRISLKLPVPNSAQRVGLVGILLAAIVSGVQGLLGGLAMHYYVDPQGIGLNSFLPFNVARALHLNSAVAWIALTWVSFSIFALPYLGINLSKKHSTIILLLTLVAGAGLLLGIFLSYNQLIPSPWWFILGAQGRPNDVDQGTLWLLLVAIVFFYASYLFFKASSASAEQIRPLVKIIAIGLAGSGLGAVIGALPVISPWAHFTADQYFSWIMIHAFVEGFWPSIVVPVLLIILVVNGLIPPSLAVIAASIDSTSEIVSGMIGTAHHYYFGGEPVFWMYIGAAASIIEVIPLGFLAYYAILLWRKGEVKNELQKTLLSFLAVTAIGGAAMGAVVDGAILNAPVMNYYLHGLQMTMAHAHFAFPMVWGLTAILMWYTALAVSGGLNDRDLKVLRRVAVLYGLGFVSQGIVLFALGGSQLATQLSYGYWAVKGVEFWSNPTNSLIIWLRTPVDVIAGIAVGIFIYYVLRAFSRAMKVPAS